MHLYDYLNQHLLEKNQLLASCDISEQQLRWLQELGVVPRPAYRLAINLDCQSFFGAHQEAQQQEYYARGTVEWLAAINTSLETEDPVASSFQLFEQRYLAQARQLAARGLLPDKFSLGDGRLDVEQLKAHIAQEWLYFCDGIYGLCTRNGLPEEIADKEFAIALIDQLTDNQQRPQLNDNECQTLTTAVAVLDRASSPFAPHERSRSSRHRCVDQVRKKYNI